MTGKPMVLTDEKCKRCEGTGEGYWRRCGLCRGTGGTWITLASALALLRRPNEGAMGGRMEAYWPTPVEEPR